jgi:hypothetical protein
VSCSYALRDPLNVIASEAKQSIGAKQKAGLLRRSAPRNDEQHFVARISLRSSGPVTPSTGLPVRFSKRHNNQIRLRIPAARCARGFARTVRPERQRAQGMPGASCTRSLACEIKQAHERSHHRYRRINRHSPRNGFTAYCVLSPATNSSCHRRWRIKGSSNPVELDFASASLTPATGARTTRLHRPQRAPIILHAG